METLKYFGTDGIRGVYGQSPMTERFAARLGFAVGTVMGDESEAHHKQAVFLIGRDTRQSGPALQYALTQGLTATGAMVWDLGILPTPGIAFLTKVFEATAGVVISASHNPPEQNGIKFFSPEGTKLSLEQELKIEALLDSIADDDLPPIDEARAFDRSDLAQTYFKDLLASQPDLNLKGLKILVDCSNGASYKLAPQVFEELGAEVVAIHVDGHSHTINVNCGSERARSNPAALADLLKKHAADLAVSFDGDADRVIFLDEFGRLIDGDHMLAILAEYLHGQGRLLGDTLVTTVMANGALRNYAEEKGFALKTTPVGDKYVTDALKMIQAEKGGQDAIGLGGEQSGHIVLLDQTHQTGDGMRTALFMLRVLMDSGTKSLAALANHIQKYPQLVASCDVAQKRPLAEIPELAQHIEAIKSSLPGLESLNSRYSGTENKYRLMLEADTRHSAAELAKIAWEICELVQAETGTPAGSKIEVLNVADGGLIAKP